MKIIIGLPVLDRILISARTFCLK